MIFGEDKHRSTLPHERCSNAKIPVRCAWQRSLYARSHMSQRHEKPMCAGRRQRRRSAWKYNRCSMIRGYCMNFCTVPGLCVSKTFYRRVDHGYRRSILPRTCNWIPTTGRPRAGANKSKWSQDPEIARHSNRNFVECPMTLRMPP